MITSTMTAEAIRTRLRTLADREKAVVLQGFFKTGRGQYGEGDVFLGITVPKVRRLVKEYDGVPLGEIFALLKSGIHEERLCALLMLVAAFSKADERGRAKIYSLYLKHTRYINNWDLVDLSAPNIVGAHLLDKNRRALYGLAKSRDLWKRRIAVLSTFTFIRQGDFEDALKISEVLVGDTHDLIHKAVGWMLREIGKRSRAAEERFLKRHSTTMPRTMLRYAIERFPEQKRKKYLNNKA